MFTIWNISVFLCLFAAGVVVFGDVIVGNCPEQVFKNCTQEHQKIIQEWDHNTTNTTHAQWKSICQSNDDLWECLKNNTCGLSDIRDQYDQIKQQCDNFNSAVWIHQGVALTLALVLSSPIITALLFS